MDLNELLRRHQLAIMAADGSVERGDRDVYLAIARIYAGRIRDLQLTLGLPRNAWPNGATIVLAARHVEPPRPGPDSNGRAPPETDGL
ncbi:hypothetical protein GRI89_01555 [Altererythrobacter salegens]|uniref:Uncharacterized protein n=1 Tax=Croceibacterium salegens TaxID=1737568 RepID=A0A6I4SQL2_9SPHN|nr:hypothetical protein [Croceibacterium salegens]MXO58231.1 hypothetical protein [Croceibacterium salegens]